MHFIVLLPMISLFLLYTAGYKLLFVSTGDKRPGQLLVQITFPSFSLYSLYALATAAQPPLLLVLVSVTALTVSLALFCSAAYYTRHEKLSVVFTEDVPVMIVDQGPYRLIRHPFYTAYILLFLGSWILHRQPIGLVCLVAIAAIYTWAARMEESKFTHSKLLEAYERYRQRTGMFWPQPAVGC
jgi:protein-S-isoprenylcysteine O-methyltransferase Ste14